MRIFLSYDSEHRAIAEKIAVRLQRKHEVFFDRDALQATDAFDEAIREWVEDKADLFIFLITPRSLAPGSYTVTELGFARQRWRDPVGHVLPVLIEGSLEDVDDAYLTSINVLVPQGNVEAEVASAVARMNRGRLPRWVMIAAAVVVIAGGAWVASRFLQPRVEHLLSGQIVDLTTSGPVAGAIVVIHRDGKPLGDDVVSDPDGRFEMLFSTPASQESVGVTLRASRDGFVSRSEVIPIGGDETPESVTVSLIPTDLAGCTITGTPGSDAEDWSSSRHGVVVGRFRMPGMAEDPDLSSRIAETLTYNINPRLQEVHVPTAVLPLFVPCDLAVPQSISGSGYMASALGADALILGDVDRANGLYTVSTYVGDSHDIFNPPQTTVSEAVNLDRPSIAQLDAETRVAVLIALIAGYELQERYDECIGAAVAAEKILVADGTLSASLHEDIIARKEGCQRKTDNFALLGDAP